MGSTPVGENSFSEYFDFRALLRYLHFIQVTNSFIIYFTLCWVFDYVKIYCLNSLMLLVYLRKRSLSYVLLKEMF